MVTVWHENTNYSMKPGVVCEFAKARKGGIAVKEASKGSDCRQGSCDFLGRETRGHDFPKSDVDTYPFGQVWFWHIQDGGLPEKAELVQATWERHRGILQPTTPSDLILYPQLSAMTVKQGLNAGIRGMCWGEQRLNLPSHGKHMQDILSWEMGREWADLPQGGFPCCRWRRCWAWQRDRAQVAKLLEPPHSCSTRQLHGKSLAGPGCS